MDQTKTERFDRPDENFVRPVHPKHVTVMDDDRGNLSLKRDRAQHRRYTAFYGDLQN